MDYYTVLNIELSKAQSALAILASTAPDKSLYIALIDLTSQMQDISLLAAASKYNAELAAAEDDN